MSTDGLEPEPRIIMPMHWAFSFGSRLLPTHGTTMASPPVLVDTSDPVEEKDVD